MTSFSFDFTQVGLRVSRPKGYRVVEFEPDSFFTLTADDLRQLEEARRTMPTTPSPEQKLAELAAAKKTNLKFRFADGTDVIRTFRPQQTVRDVYAFLREIADGDLLLARTAGHPRWLPETDDALYRVGLVPSGVLCVVGGPSGGRPAVKPALIAAAASSAGAQTTPIKA